ncbi:PilW family protein [Desulfococcus sp.]|uniref:PilW family protein n=1 Tax=Desulfococcus sp. TaxID=2025834 RepID=UPI003D0BC055
MESTFKDQSGFTLLEMLVAAMLGLVVITAALGVLNSSQLSYNVQEDIAAVQQDVRMARTFIERDVIMAGAGLGEFPRLAGLPAEAFSAFTFDNNGGENGSDILTIRYVVPSSDVCGPPPSGIGSCADLPKLTLKPDKKDPTAAMPITAAVAIVNEDLNATSPIDYNAWDRDCYCDGVTYTQPQPHMNGIIIAPGGAMADEVVITQVIANSSKLGNHPVLDYANKVLNKYPPGSTIMFFNFEPLEEIRYYLQDGALMRLHEKDLRNSTGTTTPNPVVEHIEDIQFAFGLDTDDDNLIDTWINGEDADDFDADGDLKDADKPLVRALRISVLGRTAKARRELAPDRRPALEDHPAAEATDFHRRRLSQVTVALRNMGLN